MNFATLLYWSYWLLLQEIIQLRMLAVVPFHLWNLQRWQCQVSLKWSWDCLESLANCCITFTALSNLRHLPSFNNGSCQHSCNQWRNSWQTIRMAHRRSTSKGSNSSKWAIHQEEYPRQSARTSFSTPAERRYLDGCIELKHHPSYSKKKRRHKRI